MKLEAGVVDMIFHKYSVSIYIKSCLKDRDAR